MKNSRFLSSLKLFLLYIVAVRAFSPLAKSKHGRASPSALCSVRPSKNASDQGSVKMPQRSEFLAVLGAFVTGAVVSSVEPAHATVTAANPSSSMYISDEITTLDFSLPSYDSINTLKTNGKALGVEELPEPEKNVKLPKKKAKESSGGNSPMGSVLPSMNKKGPAKSKPPKEAVEKAKKVKKEKAEKAAPAPKIEAETMDFALPSYSESIGSKEKSIFKL